MNGNNGIYRLVNNNWKIILVIVTIIVGYVTLCNTVNSHEKKITKMEPTVQQNMIDIKVINNKLDNIQLGINDIKRDLRQKGNGD